MTLNRRLLLSLGLALPFLRPGPGHADTPEERGLALATEASNRSSGYDDISVSGDMVLRTESGQEATRQFDASWISISADESRSLLVFRWPGDIRNTALLTHAFRGETDNQWLYLPAMGRVRRISGTGRSGSFVGSEFAFEDMVDQEVDKFDHLWIADQPLSGRGMCHVIDRFPTTNSGYSRQRIWLDQQELRLQQVQYFDRRGAHLKTLDITGYRRYANRYWRASRMLMQNHLTGASTILNWGDYVFDQGLRPSTFTVNALRRIN